MNIHPIFVNFPVALFTLYSISEIVHSKKLNSAGWWFGVKASMLFIGTLSAFPSVITGKMIEDEFERGAFHKLVETHQNFAYMTTIFFMVVSLLYLVAILDRTSFAEKWRQNPLFRRIAAINSFLLGSWFAVLVGLAGLALITITGALGGAIVRGPDVDPVARFVYNMII